MTKKDEDGFGFYLAAILLCLFVMLGVLLYATRQVWLGVG